MAERIRVASKATQTAWNDSPSTQSSRFSGAAFFSILRDCRAWTCCLSISLSTPAHLDQALRWPWRQAFSRAMSYCCAPDGHATGMIPARFISQVHSPGPGIEGARWLSARKIFAAGSETAPFESVPSPEMPVHVHLLVESGIHIIECLNLEELSEAGAAEFLFVAAPLKIRGGTASPIRPIALVANDAE